MSTRVGILFAYTSCYSQSMLSDDQVKKIIPEFDESVEDLRRQRADKIREALEGRTQDQTAQLLGISREGMRRMLDPAARDIAKEKSRQARAAKKADQPG